ncbi:hypothetical protein CDCA_CDCA09G2573 [Cyanidium caldarium]|uniref:Major facilitator superfamily (MFS) profile domain-containing protein n=1 Tax=Cyanidium caldarium TaxID=2771 RepID=A0AAV9IW85_CYACA|nr:hypothetical protein CDCA_CDCA09G2573 [Cyanidium caldarium]
MPAGQEAYDPQEAEEQQQIDTAVRGSFRDSTGYAPVMFGSGVVLAYDSDVDEGKGDVPSEAKELPPRYEGGFLGALGYLGGFMLTGLGMMIEGFIIVGTGQVKTAWTNAYPVCWGTKQTFTPGVTCFNTVLAASTCKPEVTKAVSYANFAGLMAGMIVFGLLADRIGRRVAMLCTSSTYLIGVIIMAAAASQSANTIFTVFSIFYAFFGFGIGGEYPLTASIAAEKRATKILQETGGEGASALYFSDALARQQGRADERARAARRGEAIGLAFAMQGFGVEIGSILLLIEFAIAKQNTPKAGLTNNCAGYSTQALNWVWRSYYIIGAGLIACVLAYRFFILRENEVYISAKRRRDEQDVKEGLTQMQRLRNHYYYSLSYYWPRLIATCLGWFINDVSFYGNGLFSGPIFSKLVPDSNLIVINGYILLKNTVALIGYYIAAFVVDRKWCGRVRLQMFGFGWECVLFFIVGGAYNQLRDNSPRALLFLYIMTSFFTQVGPNVTTYIVAAELYPTVLRATCAGLSAFWGKGGALVATGAFQTKTVSDVRTTFYVNGALNALGFILTFIFLPNATGLSLYEYDVELELLKAGRIDEYGGEGVSPAHLSYFEMWIGRAKNYKPGWLREFRTRELQLTGKAV